MPKPYFFFWYHWTPTKRLQRWHAINNFKTSHPCNFITGLYIAQHCFILPKVLAGSCWYWKDAHWIYEMLIKLCNGDKGTENCMLNKEVSVLGHSSIGLGWTRCHELVSCLYRQLQYSAGMFRNLWLVVLAVFGAVDSPLARYLLVHYWQIYSKGVGL